VTWYRRAPTELLTERPAPIPLCLSRLQHEMSLYRIWPTNLYVTTQPIKLRNKNTYVCNFSCRWLSLSCWPSRTDARFCVPASSSMILTRVHLMSMATFCLQLSTLTELVVMVGCVSIAGDRSSTWWHSGKLWQVFNIVAI